MKDWEVKKINSLFEKIDELEAENKRLKHDVETTRFSKKLDEIESSIKALTKKVDALAKKK